MAHYESDYTRALSDTRRELAEARKQNAEKDAVIAKLHRMLKAKDDASALVWRAAFATEHRVK